MNKENYILIGIIGILGILMLMGYIYGLLTVFNYVSRGRECHIKGCISVDSIETHVRTSSDSSVENKIEYTKPPAKEDNPDYDTDSWLAIWKYWFNDTEGEMDKMRKRYEKIKNSLDVSELKEAKAAYQSKHDSGTEGLIIRSPNIKRIWKCKDGGMCPLKHSVDGRKIRCCSYDAQCNVCDEIRKNRRSENDKKYMKNV